MELWNILVKEWPTLQAAPVSVGTISIACLILGWAIGRFMYGQRIEGLKGDLASADRKITDYKEKLEGKSPDEAHAQIASLRDELAALASYGLSNEAHQRLSDALAGASGKINIYKSTDASDADRLYRQTISAFRTMGWTVTSRAILGLVSAPDSGVTLVHWDATEQTLVEKVRHALDVAGLSASELVNPTGWGTETNLTIVFSSRDPDWVPAARWS